MICYRNADYLTPLRASQAQRRPGRFHRGTEDEPTQYLCLHPLGPHAEAMRRFGTRTSERHGCSISARGRCSSRCGPHRPRVRRTVGGRRLGCVPGARRHVERVRRAWCSSRRARRCPAQQRSLVRPVLCPPYGLPFRVGEIPASITGEHGCALETLVELVRFRGQPHPGRDVRVPGAQLGLRVS